MIWYASGEKLKAPVAYPWKLPWTNKVWVVIVVLAGLLFALALPVSNLLVSREPDPELLARFARYRCGSGTFRINVALAELPDFRAAPGTQPQPHHASGTVETRKAMGRLVRENLEAHFAGRDHRRWRLDQR